MRETHEKTDATFRFEELPDAPPKRRLRFSWSGKLGICVVAMWLVLAVIGPFFSPYHEADILDEALFIVPGSDNPYPETDFQGISKVAYLGTDYLGRDIMSRILWGARPPSGLPSPPHSWHILWVSRWA
jgi:peptide/nickel transport system permease protein